MSNLIEVPCGNCGKLLKVPESRAGQTGRCAYCGDSILIPDKMTVVASNEKVQKVANDFSIPKAKSTASYVAPQSRRKPKKSIGPYFIALFAFIAGIAIGHYFSSEISELLGEKNVEINHASVNKNTSNDITNKAQNPETSTSKTQNPEIIIEPGTQNNKMNSSELISTINTWENIATELDQEAKSVNQITNVLFKKYDLNVSQEIFKHLEVAEDRVRKIQDLCSQLQKSIDSDNSYAQKEFKRELDNLHGSDTMLSQLRDDKLKLQEQLNGLNEWKEGQDSSNSRENMGVWYEKLMRVISSFEKTYETVNITSGHSAIKYQSIVVEVQRIKNYTKRVSDVAKNLDQLIEKGKDPYSWVEKRKENAKSISQQKQAECLEKFLRQNKKLDIEVENEYRSLAIAIKNIKNKSEKDLASKAILSKILEKLQALNRKWEEEFQVFDSAVSNFSIQ